jgi:NAD(P)H dehydrogenase (quinone)
MCLTASCSICANRFVSGFQSYVGRAKRRSAPSLLTVLINFGFLVFGVTDYASKLTTAHYGAIATREPRDEGTQAACRLLGKRLAEWVAVFCDGRKDQHPTAVNIIV